VSVSADAAVVEALRTLARPLPGYVGPAMQRRLRSHGLIERRDLRLTERGRQRLADAEVGSR
jgi:hypothetical protein